MYTDILEISVRVGKMANKAKGCRSPLFFSAAVIAAIIAAALLMAIPMIGDVPDDSDSGPIKISFSDGIKTPVTKPTADTTVYTYTPGVTYTYTPSGFDSDLMEIQNNKQMNAGTYVVVVSLKDKDAYCWDDSTTDDLNFDFTIGRMPYTRPTADTTVFVYNTNEQTYTPLGYTGIVMTISNNKHTDSGTYDVTVGLQSNFKWSTGDETAPIHFDFVINKAPIPDPSGGTKVYNCENQTSSLVSVPGQYTVTQNLGGTDAGTYPVIAEMDSELYVNHKWAGTDDQSITVDFIIVKATISAITTDFNPEYDGLPHFPVKTDLIYTGFSTGPDQTKVVITHSTAGIIAGSHTIAVTVTGDLNFNDYTGTVPYTIRKCQLVSPTEDTTSYVYDGTEKTYTPNNIDLTYMTVTNNKRTNAGSQTVSVTLIDSGNYEWDDGTTSAITFTFTVQRKTIDIPTEDTTVFVYTGSEQIYTPVGFNDGTMNKVNDTRTNAGTQTVTVSLIDDVNCMWDDTTTGNKEYDFTIGKADYAVPDAGTKVYNCLQQTSDVRGKTGEYSVEENDGGTDAGEYDVRLKLTDNKYVNYRWSVSDDQEITIKFTISRATVTGVMTLYTCQYNGSVNVPSVDQLIFTGFIIGPDADNIDTEMITDGITAITQQMRVIVTDDHNFEDYNGTVTYEITKVGMKKPTDSTTVFTYNGEEQTYLPNGFDSDTMNIAGNQQVNADSYPVTVTIKDTVNYQWNDGTQTQLEFTFTINKMSIAKPNAGSKVFNCQIQVSDLTDKSGIYTVTKNDGGVFVNDYDVKVKLTDDAYLNCRWEGETDVQEIILVFKITKATITAVTADYQPTYDGTAHIPDVTDLVFTGFSIGPDVACIEIQSEPGQGVNAGKHTVHVIVASDTNFNDYEGNVEYTVLRAQMDKPTDDTTVFIYNGTVQTYVPTDFDSDTMQISNDTRTEAGNQVVYVTIKDLTNIQWTDGTQSSVSFTFNIGKASYDMSGLSFNDGTLTYNGTEQHHTVTGTMPTGHDGITLTVSYTGGATYVDDGSVLITAVFSTASNNYFTPVEFTSHLSIIPREVYVSGITAVERVYDGGTTITLSADEAIISNMIEGDILTVTASGHLTSKDCSDAQEAMIDSIVISGDDSDNYYLVTASCQKVTTAKITPRATQVIGAEAVSKEYDGSNLTDVSGDLTLSWLSLGDDVIIKSGLGYFDTRHAGVGKTVTFLGYYLEGGDAFNYECVQPAAGTADVTPRTVTLINGTRVISKEFDGTTSGVKLIFGKHYTFDGIVGEDKVNLIDSKCEFDEPTVIATKVSVTSLGIDNSDYILNNADLKAYISSRNITIANGPVAIEKIYDGTTEGTALVKGTHYVFENTIDGYDVNLKNPSYTYASKDSGQTTVSFKSYSIDNVNYNLKHGSLNAAVLKKELSVVNGPEPISKTYDRNDSMSPLTKQQYSIIGIVGDDAVCLIDTSGKFDTYGVTATAFILNSVEIDNQNYAVTSVSLNANILKKDVKITGLSASDKKFDDTVTATVVGTPVLEGLITGDTVTIVDGYAEFDSKDSGMRTVYFYDYAITGPDASNYHLIGQPEPVHAKITSYLGDGDLMTQITIGGLAAIIAIICCIIMIFRKK